MSNIACASVKINFNQILAYFKHLFTAKRNGHGIHSPFVYKLCENVFTESVSFYSFDELAEFRKALLKEDTEIDIIDLGAGSRSFNASKRKVKDIVRKGNSSQKQSEFYFKLINFLQSQTIIELGTSVGLNTCYLAKANSKAAVYSLEGSKPLCEFAGKVLKNQNIENAKIIHGHFDETFHLLLKSLGTFDLLYIDGNHRYDATLRYFTEALKHKKTHSVIILDDIYWSKGMMKAWEEIQQHSDVTLSIDCFYFGLLFFREEQKQKEHFKIYF